MQAFITGALTSLLTIAYVGRAYYKAGSPPDVPFRTIALTLPILYGLANYILVVRLKNSRAGAFAVGLVFGLLLSLFGRFMLDLPQKIFGFSPDREWVVHGSAMALYAVIFGVVLRWLNSK